MSVCVWDELPIFDCNRYFGYNNSCDTSGHHWNFDTSFFLLRFKRKVFILGEARSKTTANVGSKMTVARRPCFWKNVKNTLLLAVEIHIKFFHTFSHNSFISFLSRTIGDLISHWLTEGFTKGQREKLRRGVGGHFQSKNLYCRFLSL